MAEDFQGEMVAGGHGLVQVKSAAGVLAAMEREKQTYLKPKAYEKSTLAGYVEAVYKENKDHRETSGVDATLLDNLRRRMGEYSPEKLAAIQKQNGSAIFAEITGVKCRNAESWLSDVFSPDDEKAWSLKATPVPDLPAEARAQVAQVAQAFALKKAGEAMQEGQQVTQEQMVQLTQEINKLVERYVLDKLKAETDKRVRNMERHMYDQLLETEWDKVLDAFIFDLTTFPSAIIKGPIIRMRRTRRWEINEDGTSDLVIGREPMPVFERVSPFDFFPSPLARDASGPGPLVERLWLTRSALEDMKEYEGYDKTAIDEILKEATRVGNEMIPDNTESERRDLEKRGEDADASNNRDSIQGFEFHGNVPGELLIEHQIKEDNNGKQIRLGKEYNAEVMLVSGKVIYVSLNPDKLDRHPYSATSWAKVAGSFWGEAVPQLLTSVQDVCNASLRALVNNMGFSSGPQVALTDIDRIPLNEDVTDVYPFKLWQFTNEKNLTSDPVKFFLIPSNANELYSVYENFKKQADDDSGIPAYAYGNERTAGAGRALANYEPVLTPKGPVPIGEVSVGDEILNTYGSISAITGVYPQGVSNIFRLSFSNGERVDCDLNHRWLVSDHPERKDSFKVLTLGELLDRGLFRETKVDERNPKGLRPKWALPTVSPVELPPVDVRVDPYTMGVLIGDGDARARVTSMDGEIFERIPYELGVEDASKASRAVTRTVKGIKTEYLSYGLNCKSVHKFIPHDYLYNSKEVRLELLRGLMDTDGYCSEAGDHVFFCTSSERLRDDFAVLVRSLGATSVSFQEYPGGVGEARGKPIRRKNAFRVLFDLGEERVFHLERKQSRIRLRKRKNLYIAGVEQVKDSEATCITVDADNQLFLCGNYIPTHNTASGLSMLMTGASRGIKKVIRNVHRDVIRQTLERLYDWNMQFNDDPSIKGDADIVAVGAVAVLTREQASTRRLELLNFSNNPVDLKIFGLKNRAELWRQTLDTLEFDGDTLIMSDEEVEEMQANEEQMAKQQVAAETESVQADTEIKIDELKLKQLDSERKYQVELAKLEQASAEADSAEIQAIAEMEMKAKEKKTESK